MLYTDNTTDSLSIDLNGEYEAAFENKWQGFQLGMMHSF